MNFRRLTIMTVLAGAFFTAKVQSTLAAEPISKAQLTKLRGLIASQGAPSVVRGKALTDTLGITEVSGGTAPLFGIADKDKDGVIHQIQVVPNNKGFVLIGFYPEKNLIYWTDINLLLVSAVIKPANQPPTKMPTDEAREGLRRELAAIAKIVDDN